MCLFTYFWEKDDFHFLAISKSSLTDSSGISVGYNVAPDFHSNDREVEKILSSSAVFHEHHTWLSSNLNKRIYCLREQL